MSAKLIFKMEFYKFLNDKKYFIIAGVIAVLNIMLTLSYMDAIDNYSYGYGYGYSSGAGVFGILSMSYVMSAVFLFIYPFHSLAVDYKNNVMAIMMASGVNRTKLFYSKILSTILCSLLLSVIVVIIPSTLVSLRYGSIGIIGEVFGAIGDGLSYLSVNGFLLLLNMIVVYISMIIIIYAAVIFTKGSSVAVLVYFGFMIGISIIRTMFSSAPGAFDMDVNASMIYQIVTNLIVIVVFGAISLRQLKHQSL